MPPTGNTASVPSKPKFSDGEKVLCFHGPLLYEAKCIKSQIRDKVMKYFIHYSGWNKNWDEWVPESRVLKYNDANISKQKDLQWAHNKQGKKGKAVKGSVKKEPSDRESTALPPQEKTAKQKSKEAAANAATPTSENQAEMQRKKRTRAEQNVETEEEFTQKIEIRVKIPEELKHWLVDDWDSVTRQKKLVQLPARVSVETILSDYVKQKLSVKGITANKETAIIETTNGIREYFNVMLCKQLLYKFERSQYNELLSQNADLVASQIYGAIHLLRLFTKIGGALAYTQLDEDSANLITNNLYEFQKYMSKCSVTLFSQSDYIPASSDYVKKAG